MKTAVPSPVMRPMPTPWALSDVLTKLLERRVRAKRSSDLSMVSGVLALGIYQDDAFRPAVLVVGDTPLCCWAGAALSQIARGVAEEAIASRPSPTLLENFGEVLNVSVRVFAHADQPHLRLGSVGLQLSGLKPAWRSKADQAKSACTWEVAIDDYGTGKLALFDVG